MKKNLNYELMLEFIKRIEFKNVGEVFEREDFRNEMIKFRSREYGLKSLYSVGCKVEKSWGVYDFSDRFNKFMDYCESKGYCEKVGRGKWKMLFDYKKYWNIRL